MELYLVRSGPSEPSRAPGTTYWMIWPTDLGTISGFDKVKPLLNPLSALDDALQVLPVAGAHRCALWANVAERDGRESIPPFRVPPRSPGQASSLSRTGQGRAILGFSLAISSTVSVLATLGERGRGSRPRRLALAVGVSSLAACDGGSPLRRRCAWPQCPFWRCGRNDRR